MAPEDPIPMPERRITHFNGMPVRRGRRPGAVPADAPMPLSVQRADGVVKFTTALRDGAVIESVALPMRTGEKGKERQTLCLSTQAGCRMGCLFCATGRAGFQRDLDSEEIAGQVATAEALGLSPRRLVFMGMGEPLDNFDAWAESVRRLAGERDGPALPSAVYSRSTMIVSTCGLVPGLERLAALGWRKLVPAVSLNASNDAVRSSLMPVNRRHPMGPLREALSRLPLKHGVLMVEYVLFKGVNDRREHALELVKYLRGLRSMVNLIPCNPVEGASGFEAVTTEAAGRFRDWLQAEDQYARCRVPRGAGIEAACGQLAGPRSGFRSRVPGFRFMAAPGESEPGP
jgi:23S rRNA (adenine2503-C2)-methyltransferase